MSIAISALGSGFASYQFHNIGRSEAGLSVLTYDGCFSVDQLHSVGGADVTAGAAADASIGVAYRQITIHFQGFHPATVDTGAAADTGIVIYVDNPVGNNELAW